MVTLTIFILQIKQIEVWCVYIICPSSHGFLHIKFDTFDRIFVLLPSNIGQKTSNQIPEDIITQTQEDLCLNPKFTEALFIQIYNEVNNTWFIGAWEIHTSNVPSYKRKIILCLSQSIWTINVSRNLPLFLEGNISVIPEVLRHFSGY